jgi:hypothetical protein
MYYQRIFFRKRYLSVIASPFIASVIARRTTPVAAAFC